MGCRTPCWFLDDHFADAVVGTLRPREERSLSQEGMEDLQACHLVGSGNRLWEGVEGPEMNSVRRDVVGQERVPLGLRKHGSLIGSFGSPISL